MGGIGIIVGYTSQSGTKQLKQELKELEKLKDLVIGTCRSNTISLDSDQSFGKGLDLKNSNDIALWVKQILENNLFLDKLKTTKEITIFMHSMSKSINLDYPNLLIKALRDLLDKIDLLDKTDGLESEEVKLEIEENKRKINAILISFHAGSSEENPNGSHTSYGVRGTKNSLEISLLNSPDNNNGKIVDLEIFDSPSSKILGFTFVGVVGQFIEFLESYKNHPISIAYGKKLKKFLGKDYKKLIKFFSKYPLSGKLKRGQISMKEIGEAKELNNIINKLANQVNFAKLSYISGFISNLYLELAMIYLNENEDDILNHEGNRVLLDWEKIKGGYKEYKSKLKGNNIPKKRGDNIKLTKHSNKPNFSGLNLDFANEDSNNKNSNKDISGVFVIEHRLEEGNIIECKFNPTKENFDILGNKEVGGHFGVIPLFMINGLIYDLGLLNENEYIKETRVLSTIYTGNEIIVKKINNEIILCNKNNPREIFAKIEISKILEVESQEQGNEVESQEQGNEVENVISGKKGFKVINNYSKYQTNLVPHGIKWFEIFSQDIINTKPFGLLIDVRAIIIEVLGIKLARNYFLNPKAENIDSLKEFFPKLKDFSNLKGMFGRFITNKISPDFEKKILGNKFDVLITKIGSSNGILLVDLCIAIGNEIIAEYSCTIA